MKTLISIIVIMFVAVGCGKTEVETKTERVHPDGDQPPLDLPLIGSYERKEDEHTEKLVFLENKTVETYFNGEKNDEGTWKMVGNGVYVVYGNQDLTVVCKIEPNGDLIHVSETQDGKRTEFPNEGHQLTWKKLKE